MHTHKIYPPKRRNQPRGARILLALSVMVFMFVGSVAPSHAVIPVVTVEDVPRKTESIFSRIKKVVGSVAFHSALRFITYRLAQDSAVWLASGDKGKKPLVFQQPLGDALTDIGDQIAGTFLVNVSQGLPINLCSPQSVQSRLKLTIGVSKSIQDIDLFPDRPGLATSGDLGKTGCSLSDITGNFGAAFANQKQAFKNLSKGFELDRNELGAFLVLRENVQKEKQKQIEQEKIERAGEVPKAVKDLITGVTVTPSFQVTETQKQATEKALKQDVQPTGDIFVDAAAIFANTFAQTYLRRLQRGLLRGNIARTGGRGPGGLGSTAAVSQASFKNVFGEPPSFGISGGSVNLISDMSICPASEDPNVYQSPYNCLLSDGFKQAVEQKLTVAQAVEQGMIPGDTLFPQAHVASQPNLSEENLKRLRFLRVVPLGWELAASRLGSQAVPFKKLLDCFDVPAGAEGCPEGGQSISHLVDPAWVLALPQAECRALAYSSLPEHAQSPNRQSVCVDLASCLNEDANGNCTGGFGYCTRERVTWQLTGQSCEPQYATCQSFTSPKPLNLLTAYVDNAGCTAQAAGCKWYSTKPSGDAWDQSKKIYLNNNAQSCSASQAESQEVIPLVPGVNYIKNPGFDEELFSARPSGIGSIGSLVPPAPEEGGWNLNGEDLNVIYVPGAGAIAPSDASQEITIKPYTYYTFSFFAFPNPNDAAVLDAIIEVSASGPLKSVSFPDYSFAESNTLTLAVPNLGTYQGSRFAATFYSANQTRVVIHLKNRALYDDIQLEEIKLQQGADAIATVAIASQKGIATLNTVPVSGSFNVASPTTAYKAYGTENKSVFADAGECTAEETSARPYTPVAGGSARYARLTANGLCAAACNGFDTLLAMPTPIERLVDPNTRPTRAQFIPNQAQSCTREQVGCEAFTNAQTEARAYFNRIESCVLDANPNTATFYTWEGNNLKTWQLLKDVHSGGPCAVFPQGARQGAVDPASASCQDQAGGSPVCSDDEQGTLCRTFISDENGVEYRRDANKIVTASGQCTQFRRAAEAGGVQESWYFIPSEANQCSSAAVGCREYKGKRANVVRSLFTEPFEGELDDYQDASQWDIPNVGLSSDTAANQGRSVLFDARLSMMQAFADAIAGRSFAGNTYELRFVAKGTSLGGVAITGAHLTTAGGGDEWFFRGSGSPNAVAGDPPNIIAPEQWRDYALGPLYWPRDEEPAFLRITVGGGALLLDDMELVQIPDTYYRLESSTVSRTQGGNQPDACYNPDPDGDPALDRTIPRWNSCQAYRDDKSNTYYVSEFDKLFGNARSLTCTAVIDTRNSDYPYSQAFSMGTEASPAWHAVPADTVNYRYIDPANKVAASAAGCTALGSPPAGSDPDTAVADWSAAYKRVDPDEFTGANGSLCNQEGLWCEAFTAASGGTYYFRDPGDKLCAWNPDAPGTNGQGGFVQPDDPNALCNTTGGYVPLCPAEANSCTAYKPTRSDLSEGAATTLFRIADEVSAGDCTGPSVDAGCVEFSKGHFTSASGQYDPAAIPKSKFSDAEPGVLSVTQARQCAEWLAPTTTSQAKEPSTQAERTVTYDLGRCQQMNPSGTACVKWVTPLSGDYPPAYKDGGVATVFDLDEYRGRYDGGKTIYSGAWDYSGYSLPNQYPVEVLAESGTGADTRLGYLGAGAMGLECRGYPEQDSPFSRGSIQERSNYSQPVNFGQSSRLRNLNLCEESGENCQCSYKKVDALDQTVYLPKASQRALPADTRQISSHQGWYGYCLERSPVLDPSGNSACLAWWPVDVVQGKPNVFENHPEAGFVASQPLYYCAAGKGNRIDNSTFFITPGEERDNTYVLALAEGGDPEARRVAYDANFYECSATNDFCKVDGTRGSGGGIDHPVRPLVQGNTATGAGQQSATGLLQFPVKPQSPLGKLYEYDIEAIKLVVKRQQDSGWPTANEEFIINRDGSARSSLGVLPETRDNRWTTLWCGGSRNANCDFGGEYSWDKFMLPIMNSDNCGEGGADPISSGNNTNIFALRARFAGPDGSVDGFNVNGTNVGGNGPPSFPPGSIRGDASPINPYQFLGFEGGFCDNTNDTGWVDFQIKFQLREWCTDVVAVTGEEGENKAWTGRIQGNGKDWFIAATKYLLDNGGLFQELYTTDFMFVQDAKPFGAITPPAETIYDPTKWDARLDEEKDEFTGETKALEPGVQPLYVEDSIGQVRAGSPYSCKGPGGCIVPPSSDSPAIETTWIGGVDTDAISNRTAMTYLKQIFAKVYRWWQWSTGLARYVSSATNVNTEYPDGDPLNPVFSTVVGDAAIINPTFGQCPVIQAARRSERGYEPEDNEKNVPINSNCGISNNYGRYSINGTPIAHSGAGKASGEPNNSIEAYVGEEVRLEFYGYNFNGEQLPLRKITIDWVGDTDGDGNTNAAPEDITTISGNFKNHRWDCGEGLPEWGRKPAACNNKPFVFTHVYQKAGPVSPKVRVEDNWGVYSWSSYNPNTPVLQIEYLDLSIMPPENLRITDPAGDISQGAGVTFAWDAPASQTGITGYKVRVKKDFSNGSTVVEPSGAHQGEDERSLIIIGDQNLKSLLFQARTCTDDGCGPPATQFVAFKPMQAVISSFAPGIPAFGDEVTVNWGPPVSLADFYEVEITKDNGAPVTIDAADIFYAIPYEPEGLASVQARVRGCNNLVCGNYSSPVSFTYQ
ncbi:MAG: fibronectin type III domain-containing protein [Parcubacteria group bacterium]|nr:fibronectin type III domain-containing protein [Parcubacteria group bacterium]